MNDLRSATPYELPPCRVSTIIPQHILHPLLRARANSLCRPCKIARPAHGGRLECRLVFSASSHPPDRSRSDRPDRPGPSVTASSSRSRRRRCDPGSGVAKLLANLCRGCNRLCKLQANYCNRLVQNADASMRSTKQAR
jgi:hypothetical protein